MNRETIRALNPATSRSYAVRIERVVKALHSAPDRIWRLEDMAAIACFSPWHFHRVYRAICGETPEETRRRLLLHRAAVELIEAARDIAPIARRAGYRSVAAFTRAFAQAYGRPPVAYRMSRPPRFLARGGVARPQTEENDAMYEITITQEPARRLVGLPHHGSYQEIGQAFQRLCVIAHGLGLDPDTPMIGLYYDDPDSVPTTQLRSFAALEIDAGVQASAPLELRATPGGPAVSIVHKGPYAELSSAYDWLYREWLPHSGREPGDAPCHEIYLNDPRSTLASELLTRVVMPLKP